MLAIVLPRLNVAVALAAAVIVREHVPVPVHAPVHPPKVSLPVGVSLSVTWLFGAKSAEHPVLEPAEQLIPAGELVTVPVPGPVSATVNAIPPLNAAETFVAAETVTTQVLVPVQLPPLHPAKNSPDAAAAVSVTCVFGAKPAVHVVGQLIPAGLLVTVPDPVRETVSASPVLNDAETLVLALSVTEHVLVPVQPPLHPAKK